MTMKLYGKRQSRAARCLWLLEEMGQPFEQIPIDLAAGEGRTPAFRALNPAGKVPVLVDGAFELTESIAINAYLASGGPTTLWPDHPQARARIGQWSSWAVSEMEPPVTAIVREKRAAAAGARDADAALIAAAADDAASALGTLEHALAGVDHLLPAGFTLADIDAATAAMVAPMILDIAAFPHTRAWLARCFARPAWQRVQARP